MKCFYENVPTHTEQKLWHTDSEGGREFEK